MKNACSVKFLYTFLIISFYETVKKQTKTKQEAHKIYKTYKTIFSQILRISEKII